MENLGPCGDRVEKGHERGLQWFINCSLEGEYAVSSAGGAAGVRLPPSSAADDLCGLFTNGSF